ncbi:aminoglycoside phosphotransferase family protein [Streptomyces camponoticapitis]|uniref:aminoglycoside phosphotransferase family protein n=1 Tax=Streptomyces camponoticapitis TaxID=1616125 RepID=UPI00166C169E|nr:aminoglycoside phosphotransferase family protein [Streptomyces camponoticapitis]
MRYALAEGVRQRGHHNDNFLVAPTAELAAPLGLEPGAQVMLRRRHPGVLPVVLRTWLDESEILRSIKGRLKYVPECLVRMDEFAVHSYVEGVPLSTICSDDRPVDSRLLRALAGVLAEMTAVRRAHLPGLPASWPRDGATRSFLRTLAVLTDRQVRQPNRAEFGGLFAALGVPEEVMGDFAGRVPTMQPRPFSLLHTDLHRDNVILSYFKPKAPLICVDWELASYGDPLHDLATHLVRMRYPAEQWDDVKEAWALAMRDTRPQAANGLETDLQHYLDFERAQSVYPDVMRAAQSLGRAPEPVGLERATEAVRAALELARGPLRLSAIPQPAEIGKALYRWYAAQPGRAAQVLHPVGVVPWVADEEVLRWSGYPMEAVSQVLSAEGAAGAEHVFKGTGHLSTVVKAGRGGETVVVRRRLDDSNRRERRFLDEHLVLHALEPVRARVRAPEVLARGISGFDDQFVIHSYVGPADGTPPEHPVDGLGLREADDLVDQLCALTDVPTHGLGPDVVHGDFYQWLSGRLIEMVADLPKESLRLAGALGLPNANRLHELLVGRRYVSPRTSALLHGDLNPWNLIRNETHDGLTIIDWEMAMVGDPLYDLVRHLHLTPHGAQTRERMLGRWSKRLDPEFTRGWEEDWRFYRWMEIVRSAYIDLDRLLTGESLDTPNVRRAVDSYSLTLSSATASLGLRARLLANPYLARALPGGDLIGADG